MSELTKKIKAYINDDAKSKEAFLTRTIEIQNDGGDDYIAKWEYAEKSKPTQEQLDAL
tara:strand:- start:393 stop:566 length:174 start_codon:yes stop_codon:yes gene_type:complete